MMKTWNLEGVKVESALDFLGGDAVFGPMGHRRRGDLSIDRRSRKCDQRRVRDSEESEICRKVFPIKTAPPAAQSRGGTSPEEEGESKK